MLKHIFTYTTLVLAITACSKTEKPVEKPADKPASTVATQTASTPTTQSTPTVASTPTSNASVTNATTKTANLPSEKSENHKTKPQNNIAPSEAKVTNITPVMTAEKAVNQSNNKSAEDMPLKADLAKLFKTINDIDTKHQAKQAELGQKIQSAESPEAQKQVFDEVIKLLDVQKQTINALTFHDKRVGQIRDKMLKNIDETKKGMVLMAQNPEATPQTHPQIAKTMQEAEKTAAEVRESVQKLVTEAGIDPNVAP